MGQPSFTTFGEILNFNRLDKKKLPSREGIPPSFFFRPESDPVAFQQSAAFLDRIVTERGFAYKDVVQPFVVAAWLRTREEFRILRIRRNLADVAMAMLELKWWYPIGAAKCNADIESALVEGLVLAENVLAALPAVTIEYEDLIRDGTALSSALSKIYPECEWPAVRFRNDRLGPEHAKMMARRALPQYLVLKRKIQDLQAGLPSVPCRKMRQPGGVVSRQMALK